MHFPVTDITRSVRSCLGETRRRSRLALGRGYHGDGRDVRQILLDYLFSFADPAVSAGCAPIISLLDPRPSSSTDRLRKMRKYGRAVVGLNQTLMPVLSVWRKRPPDKSPPGIKETADPAVTAIGAASPLLAISLRRPSPSEMLPRLAARSRWWPPDNCSAPRPTSRRDARLRASSGSSAPGAASISRSV